MKRVIQGILGKPFHTSIVEVIESPDGPITDQAEIQDHLTKEWEAKFQHPAAVCAESGSSANPDGPVPICEYVGGVSKESEGDERISPCG
jgi:hypothetical protein